MNFNKKRTIFVLVCLFIFVIIFFVAFIFYQQSTRNVVKNPVLLSGFPSTPVYPNSHLTNSVKTLHNAGDYSYHATWETSDPVNTTMSWYLKRLSQLGWFIDNYPAQDQADFIQFADGHQQNDKQTVIQLSVIRDKEKNVTQITVEYPAKSAGIED